MTLNQAFEAATIYARTDLSAFTKALLCYYADIAQKEIAISAAPIVKRFDVSKSNSKPVCYDMPKDSIGFDKIIRRGSALPVNYSFDDAGRIVISDYGKLDIYYRVLPDTVNENTPDSYSFEVDVRTHRAIPFYIAYRLSDNEEIMQGCLAKWNKLNSLAKQSALKIRYSNYYL